MIISPVHWLSSEWVCLFQSWWWIKLRKEMDGKGKPKFSKKAHFYVTYITKKQCPFKWSSPKLWSSNLYWTVPENSNLLLRNTIQPLTLLCLPKVLDTGYDETSMCHVVGRLRKPTEMHSRQILGYVTLRLSFINNHHVVLLSLKQKLLGAKGI